mgnify:FL=1
MPITYEELQARKQEEANQRIEQKKQQNPTVSPEVIEYLSQLEKINKESVNHTGNIVALGAELGGGIGGLYALDKIHKADKFGKVIKGIQATRAASLLGFAGPQVAEPISTITGGLTFMGSSAVIWGLSNLAGQNIRKAYGLQEGISSGELIATSVFGGLVPPVGKVLKTVGKSGADKQLLKLTGQTAGDFGAFKKGGYILLNGAKSFASGAALSISETAVRQELQIHLNERENRDTYEYILAGGFGGSMNSVLGMWAKTGWWGRRQRSEVTDKAKANISKQLVDLKAQLKELEATDDFVFFKQSKIKKLKTKINDTKQAFDIVDDAAKAYKKENEAAEKIETGQTRKSFEDKVETKIGEKITPEDKPFILEEINDLKERRKQIANDEARQLNKDEKSLRPVFEPRLKKDATDLAEELDDELSNELADFIVKEKAGESTEVTLKKIKQIVVNQAELFEEVIAPIDASAGRALQASSKRRGEFYNYALDSAAATKRKEALDDLLLAIDVKISNPTFEGVTGNTFKKIFDDLDVNIEQIKKVNEDIARAVKKKSKEPKIQKLNKTDNEATIKKLEEELDELRTGRVDTNEPKNIARDTAPRERVLKEQIKFYKQADKEIKAIVKLEKELEDILKLSPEEFKKLEVEQRVKKELLAKQQAESKSVKIKKKIQQAKTRLRKQAAKAEKQLKDTEEFEFYAKLENYIFDNLDQTMGSTTRKLFSTLTSSRQLSILSLASAASGIPTGIYGITKQFVKPHTTFLRNIVFEKDRNLPLSYKLYLGDLASSFAVFDDLKGMAKASYLTAKRLQSVTDPKRGSRLLNDGGTVASTPQGAFRTYRQTRISAGRRAGAKRNVVDIFNDFATVGKFMHLISGPLRLIVGADEGFRRQLARQVTTATARKKAILQDHFENNPKKNVMDIEEDLIKTAWTKNADGIDVIQETDDFITGLNFSRQEMFYASTGDSVGDVYLSLMERGTQKIQRVLGNRPALNFLVRIFVPFVDVTIRSVVRGSRISAGPALPLFYKIFDNPYVKQIKKLDVKIEEMKGEKKNFLAREANKELADRTAKDIDVEIVKIRERLEKLEYRKTEFNEEILADGFMGTSLMTMGVFGSLMRDGNDNPLVTGSMAYMSREDREKMEARGVKPFTAFGISYRAMAPLMMPVAIASDFMNHIIDKDQGIIDKDKNFLTFIPSIGKMIAEELPFNSGLKQLTDLFPDGTEESEEKAKRAWSRLFGSYIGVVTPADLDKIVKYLSTEGKKADFKGEDFKDLLLYDAFGFAPVNFDRDILGNKRSLQQTFLQLMFRYIPNFKTEVTPIENVISLDVNNILGSETRKSFRNIKMLEFRSKDTKLDLHNEFCNRLKKVTIRKKKLETAVNRLIKSKRWKKEFNNGAISIDDKGNETNLALEELNSLIDDYYDKVQDQIIKESRKFKKSFINKDGETLLDVLEKSERAGEVTREVKPFSERMGIKIK